MKFKTLILTILSFSWFTGALNSSDSGVNISLNNDDQMTIVIDPGHGGHDQGCHGGHSIEKHLALKISLEFGQMITNQFPDVKVIYTRTEDVFVPLNERADIANHAGADLFISIHCNALGNVKVRGTETFVMGLHKSEENLQVAKRENESILLEKDYVIAYDGYDPNTAQGHIIMSMYQNAYLEESLDFAQMIEKAFDESPMIKSRGVKQAGFVVLRKTTMPSVLIETGFLTNITDRELLESKTGRTAVVNALMTAFAEYKTGWNERQGDKAFFKPNVSVPLISASTDIHAHQAKPQQNVQKEKNHPTEKKSDVTTLPLAEKPHKKTKIANPTFSVQLAATLKEIPLKDKWADLNDLEVIKVEEMYKYVVGNFNNKAGATEKRDELLKKGFVGAFVVVRNTEEKIND